MIQLKKLLSFAFLVWIISGVSPAFAQGSISAAVLNLEGEGVETSLTDTLTSVVRNEAQQVENYEIVNKVAINFQDILLVLGCSADSTVCLKRAAGELNARMLIFGKVTRRSGSFQITLNIFDAETGQMVNKLSKTIRDTDDPIVAFQKEIESFFRKDSPAQHETSLRIGSNVSDARVLLEDTFVGMVPLERKGLPPGRYRVIVEHPDYESWETALELKAGADLELWAPLKRKAAVVAAPVATQTVPETTDLKADAKLDDQKVKGVNWGAWSAIGVGGLALLGSGVFAILMVDVEDQISQAAEDGSLTQARYDELTNRGENYELTHRILLGVGAASLIGGTVWLLVDSGSESTASLQVGTQGTTVQARLRW